MRWGWRWRGLAGDGGQQLTMCGGGGRTFVLEVNKGSKSSKDERASLKVSSALRHRSRRSNLRRGSTLMVSSE